MQMLTTDTCTAGRSHGGGPYAAQATGAHRDRPLGKDMSVLIYQHGRKLAGK
jgi:hypothetical protein